ncbi:MAG: aryl-sulfate sulfotransferase [Acidobacteriota bacterium]|nr:aryl-sulfate sulfotransferase [Acidobacteriota bacterium]
MRYFATASAGLVLALILLSGCGGDRFVATLFKPLPTPITGQSGSVTISPQFAAIGVAGTTQFTANVAGGGGTVQWELTCSNGTATGCGMISSTGLYTAPTAIVQSQNVTITAQLASAPQSNYAQALTALVSAGVVSPTANPQVASYTLNLPDAGSMTVNFGENTSYNFPTSAQTTTAANSVPVPVAGMLGNTQYHLQATAVLTDTLPSGQMLTATFTDSDHTFTTGKPFGTSSVAAGAVAGATPQTGIELFDTAQPQAPAMAFATDLKGNVIWTYSYAQTGTGGHGTGQDFIQPVELLPNGHFLVQLSYLSSIPLHKGQAVQPTTLDEVREVDLAGTTIRDITAAQVIASVTANTALSAELSGVTLGSLHHDVLDLPNGHMVLLFSGSKSVNVSPAITGAGGVSYSGPTTVLGDVIVDVDQSANPDWVWNSFDHLDVNRVPWPAQFSDWTHSNAMLYSSSDGNLLLSIRHQNWIIKIDYNNANGTGNIMWRLGEGGDFTLNGGTDPTDWFYAQHKPNYFTSNTTGNFTLGVMDNGDDRILPGVPVGSCVAAGSTPATSQCYSTMAVFQVNESNMTATLVEHYQPTPAIYSFFGGDVTQLPNGNRHVAFSSPVGGSQVYEVSGPSGSAQVVWQAITKGTNQYRAERLPSLYPGVTW